MKRQRKRTRVFVLKCMELRVLSNRFPAKNLGEGPLALQIVLSHLQLAILMEV